MKNFVRITYFEQVTMPSPTDGLSPEEVQKVRKMSDQMRQALREAEFKDLLTRRGLNLEENYTCTQDGRTLDLLFWND